VCLGTTAGIWLKGTLHGISGSSGDTRARRLARPVGRVADSTSQATATRHTLPTTAGKPQRCKLSTPGEAA
jgi:hypothetical protein